MMTLKMMTLNEYQSLAQRTRNKALSPDEHLLNGCLGLAGETGEVCDLVKKCLYQDGRDIREKLYKELGDVLWYVAETASAMGWDLNGIAMANIEKLQARYGDGFSPDKSLFRKE